MDDFRPPGASLLGTASDAPRNGSAAEKLTGWVLLSAESVWYK